MLSFFRKNPFSKTADQILEKIKKIEVSSERQVKLFNKEKISQTLEATLSEVLNNESFSKLLAEQKELLEETIVKQLHIESKNHLTYYSVEDINEPSKTYTRKGISYSYHHKYNWFEDEYCYDSKMICFPEGLFLNKDLMSQIVSVALKNNFKEVLSKKGLMLILSVKELLKLQSDVHPLFEISDLCEVIQSYQSKTTEPAKEVKKI